MDVEIIFFIVAAIIATISKLHEKSKRVREKSLAQQRKRESSERLELIPKRAEPVAPAPIALPQALAPARTVPTAPVRPRREAPARPPRRTRRVVTAPVRATVHRAPTVDVEFVQRLGRSPQALREAIMLREILGPPVAMRGFRFPRR
ncbi:MAG: hypothetical protein ACYS0E_02640 [Planctomycetota bacterium]|jgi:hypothetical protein